MGSLLEEILKSATSGDGSILGSIIKKTIANDNNDGELPQASVNPSGSETSFPNAGGSNNPFDIGDELDDIANGRNQGSPSAETDSGFNIPSMEGFDIGDILKKIVLGGSAIPIPTGQKEESESQEASAPSIDIGDILGKLGIGLGGSSNAGAGGILQTIISIIKMIKSAKGTSRAGLIEEQLSQFMTPDEISQFMAAIDEEPKE